MQDNVQVMASRTHSKEQRAEKRNINFVEDPKCKLNYNFEKNLIAALTNIKTKSHIVHILLKHCRK